MTEPSGTSEGGPPPGARERKRGRVRERRRREPFSAQKETEELMGQLLPPITQMIGSLASAVIQAVRGLVDSAYQRGRTDAIEEMTRVAPPVMATAPALQVHMGPPSGPTPASVAQAMRARENLRQQGRSA